MPSPKQTPENKRKKAKARAMFKDGVPPADIARRLATPNGTVHNWIADMKDNRYKRPCLNYKVCGNTVITKHKYIRICTECKETYA